MAAETETERSTLGDIWDIVKVVLQALALAILVRIFLFQPFNIPTGSMINTLLVGDYLFVSKYSYGFSQYSFPFDAIPFSGRIWEGKPERGDVAVFRKPADTSLDYIKRVIGLPGDEIQLKGGTVYINGQAVQREHVEDYMEPDFSGNMKPIPRYEETLPNGVSYFVLDRNPRGSFDDTGVYKVPDGHYFMMGDNRDNSSDSRDADGGVGFVPIENFIGKAQIIFFSGDEHCRLVEPWNWPWTIRWSRFFGIVR